MEPFIKSSNAHGKVSVSPDNLYMYNNTIVEYINSSTINNTSSNKSYNSLGIAYSISDRRAILLDVAKLRPLTIAERILFLNVQK